MMNPTEMEDAIKNLDHRIVGAEQILPSLATRDDLRAEGLATRADLRAEIQATSADLRAEIDATKADLRAEIHATRVELRAEIQATRSELIDRIDAVKRHTDMRIEDARDDIRTVAEGVASLSTSLQANTRVLQDVVRRLDLHETILQTLVQRGA